MIAIDLNKKRVYFHSSLTTVERYSKLMDLFYNNRMLVEQVQFPPFPKDDGFTHHYQLNPMPIKKEHNYG